MSRYYGEWAPYVSVAERRKQAEREVARMRQNGQPVAPLFVKGRAIATTFWGKAWCENLESYRDFENRLPRGRSYVRNGSVMDLQITPLAVNALVSGSSIYKTTISIAAVPKAHWRSICQDCAGGIDSLVELLRGRLSTGVMERICRQDKGLFPRPSEIRFSCSCPDFASMCKHVAATLYGVGARLDEKPELLFRLRAVDENDLLANLDATTPLSAIGPAAGKILDAGDISALFGLDMADGEAPVASKATARTKPVDPKKSRLGKASVKNTPLRKPSQPVPEPVKLAEPASVIQAAPPAKHARTRGKAVQPARTSPQAPAPAKPASKKPSGGTTRSKPALELTQDGCVKWWK
jgi:uncharacterized Zn finger protein